MPTDRRAFGVIMRDRNWGADMKHSTFDDPGGQGDCVTDAREVTPLSRGRNRRRVGLREVSVLELLEWAFAVEHAELSDPDELVPVASGAGMEWRLMQQARLGCRVDGGGRSLAQSLWRSRRDGCCRNDHTGFAGARSQV